MTALDLFLVATVLLVAWVACIARRTNFVFAAMGDEGQDTDIKIAPEKMSSAGTEQGFEEARQEAEVYLRQKSLGNVGKARTLGGQFADLLIETVEKNFNPWPEQMADSLRAHHLVLLFSYAVNRVVTQLSPNSILAHTALGVFYNEVETRVPELDKCIKDMASYSLYVLCERGSSCTDQEIGKIYARLCGDRDNPALIDEGEAAFMSYHKSCAELHERARYLEG